MKFFDVECPKCGKFEIKADETGECPRVCPICGRELKRVFGSTPVIYKAAGFTKRAIEK